MELLKIALNSEKAICSINLSFEKWKIRYTILSLRLIRPITGANGALEKFPSVPYQQQEHEFYM